MDDLVTRLLRWADSDDDTILGKRKPDPTCLKRQAAARIQALETALAEAEGVIKFMATGGFGPRKQRQMAREYLARHCRIATALETGEWKK